MTTLDFTGKTKLKLKPVEVTTKQEIAPGVFVLSFRRGFSFIPGQVVAVAMHPDDQYRFYSIASGMQEPDIHLLFDLRPGGQLTPVLASLNSGDTIYISDPTGNFYGTAKPSVWISAGTGIAPFISMWRSGLKRNKLLVHSGRFLHSFYFEDEFMALGKNYIRCCTREAGEGVYHGRINKWINEQAELPDDRRYYLCGSAEMVVDTRDALIEKGISYENIVAEIYF
jgi:ferredoxin/flavodoxin---NADP+ reductase